MVGLIVVVGIVIVALFVAFLFAFLVELILRYYRPDARDRRTTAVVAVRFALYWAVVSFAAVAVLVPLIVYIFSRIL